MKIVKIEQKRKLEKCSHIKNCLKLTKPLNRNTNAKFMVAVDKAPFLVDVSKFPFLVDVDEASFLVAVSLHEGNNGLLNWIERVS